MYLISASKNFSVSFVIIAVIIICRSPHGERGLKFTTHIGNTISHKCLHKKRASHTSQLRVNSIYIISHSALSFYHIFGVKSSNFISPAFSSFTNCFTITSCSAVRRNCTCLVTAAPSSFLRPAPGRAPPVLGRLPPYVPFVFSSMLVPPYLRFR